MEKDIWAQPWHRIVWYLPYSLGILSRISRVLQRKFGVGAHCIECPPTWQRDAYEDHTELINVLVFFTPSFISYSIPPISSRISTPSIPTRNGKPFWIRNTRRHSLPLSLMGSLSILYSLFPFPFSLFSFLLSLFSFLFRASTSEPNQPKTEVRGSHNSVNFLRYLFRSPWALH